MLTFNPIDRSEVLTLAKDISTHRKSLRRISLPDSDQAMLRYLLHYQEGHASRSRLVACARIGDRSVGFFTAEESANFEKLYHFRIGVEAAALWPPFRSKGIGKSFILALKDLMYQFFSVNRFGASVSRENTSMSRLLCACGFEKVGVPRHWDRGKGDKPELLDDYVTVKA